LICNKTYKEKADGRKGGVGTESMIMSSEIYAKADQDKFIPLIFEADEYNKPYTPIFVHSRVYLDFKNEDVFETSYEQLIRNIFEKPTYKRPPIGIRPSYLNDDTPLVLATAHRVVAIKNAFANERKNAPLLVKEYYKAFLAALRAFEPKEREFTQDNFIETALSRIEQLTPLRDDFVTFLEMYCSATPDIDQDALHDFFEQLAQYFTDTRASEPDGPLDSLQYDYLRFFAYELVLYVVTILLRNSRYDVLGNILYDSYIVSQRYSEADPQTFISFNIYNSTLNKYYNKKFAANRTSFVADKIKERVLERHSFDELKQADVLLHYVSWFLLITPEYHVNWIWRPETVVYDIHRLPLFEKAISKRHFDKIKVLLAVDSVEELVKKVAQVQEDNAMKHFGGQLRWELRNLPDMRRGLNIDKLASIK